MGGICALTVCSVVVRDSLVVFNSLILPPSVRTRTTDACASGLLVHASTHPRQHFARRRSLPDRATRHDTPATLVPALPCADRRICAEAPRRPSPIRSAKPAATRAGHRHYGASPPPSQRDCSRV